MTQRNARNVCAVNLQRVRAYARTHARTHACTHARTRTGATKSMNYVKNSYSACNCHRPITHHCSIRSALSSESRENITLSLNGTCRTRNIIKTTKGYEPRSVSPQPSPPPPSVSLLDTTFDGVDTLGVSLYPSASNIYVAVRSQSRA